MDGKVARGDIRKLQRLSIICIVWFLFSTLILRSLIKNHFLVMALHLSPSWRLHNFQTRFSSSWKRDVQFNHSKNIRNCQIHFFGNLTYMTASPCDFSTLCSTIPKVMQSKSRCIFKQFLIRNMLKNSSP